MEAHNNQNTLELHECTAVREFGRRDPGQEAARMSMTPEQVWIRKMHAGRSKWAPSEAARDALYAMVAGRHGYMWPWEWWCSVGIHQHTRDLSRPLWKAQQHMFP